MTERVSLAFDDEEYSAPRLVALANGLATKLPARGVGPRIDPKLGQLSTT